MLADLSRSSEPVIRIAAASARPRPSMRPLPRARISSASCAFPESPRHVSLEAGRALSAAAAKGRALRAALVVDATDAELDAIVEALDPDLLQLHGAESPERVRAVRARTGRPAMKAIGVADGGRPRRRSTATRAAADRLLLDAKPPRAPARCPAATAVPSTGRLLAGLDPGLAFMCRGASTPRRSAQAIALTGAARRRRVLRRREPAGRQGPGADQGVRRGGAGARSRATPPEMA